MIDNDLSFSPFESTPSCIYCLCTMSRPSSSLSIPISCDSQIPEWVMIELNGYVDVFRRVAEWEPLMF
jgi:hypothetical protein